MVTSIFKSESDAEGAMWDLLKTGVLAENLSYIALAPENTALESSKKEDGDEIVPLGNIPPTEKKSCVLGGLAATTGNVAGLGEVCAAGTVAEVLHLSRKSTAVISEAVAASTTVRSLAGALAAFGVAREDAETYEEHVRRGEVLVIVTISKEVGADEIKDILSIYRGKEVRVYKKIVPSK